MEVRNIILSLYTQDAADDPKCQEWAKRLDARICKRKFDIERYNNIYLYHGQQNPLRMRQAVRGIDMLRDLVLFRAYTNQFSIEEEMLPYITKLQERMYVDYSKHFWDVITECMCGLTVVKEEQWKA